MSIDPKIVTVHALGGVGIGTEAPKYKCPAHGNVDNVYMTVKMHIDVYKFDHKYCLVCYDEFLRGKRSSVNMVK